MRQIALLGMAFLGALLLAGCSGHTTTAPTAPTTQTVLSRDWISPADASGKLGQKVTVEMAAKSASQTTQYGVLLHTDDFTLPRQDGFSVQIPPEALKNFEGNAKAVMSRYSGKTLHVTGVVARKTFTFLAGNGKEHNADTYVIVVEKPEQIVIK